MKFSAEEIGAVLGVPVQGNPNVQLLSACIDSRSLTEQALFFARKGEKRDGHQFVSQVLEHGAKGVVIESRWVEQAQGEFAELLVAHKDASFFVVADATKALGVLAGAWREKLQAPVIAITGSSGKTSTKEVLASLLSSVIGVGASNVKSYNNHTGLPLTILGADSSVSWLVLEAGMNAPGELEYLSSIARPDVACILNVGDAHIGKLGSREAIRAAKCELVTHLRSDGTAVAFADDGALVAAVKAKLGKTQRLRTFGESEESDLRVSNYVSRGAVGFSAIYSTQEESITTESQLVGKHHALNIAASLLMAITRFPNTSLERFSAALKEARPASMRGEVLQLGELIVINDAYNANPQSVAAALESAKTIAGEKTLGVVLGDMLELGRDAERLHHAVGQRAAKLGVARLAAVGDYAAAVAASAKQGGVPEVQDFKQINSVLEFLLAPGDNKPEIVLVKGSRAMQLERIVKQLQEN